MDSKSQTNSPLKNLLNKPFNIGSPPYVPFASKVRLTYLSIWLQCNIDNFLNLFVIIIKICLQRISNTAGQSPQQHSQQSQPQSSSSHLPSPAPSIQSTSSTLPPQCSIIPQSPMPATEPQDALNSIKIQNCVATVNLGCDLNLQKINFRTRNSEYNPSRFHGVIMRIREPRCTALIFRSGKVVCTGARNEVDANLGTRKFARILQKLGNPVSVWIHK